LHPSDRQIPRENRIDDQLLWRQENKEDLWPFLLKSDLVVGMRSSALLEASLLNCRTASYQPNLIGENQCAAVKFGVAARLDSVRDLRAWLGENLAAETRSVSLHDGLPFIRPDAALQAADLVLHAVGRP
jgi:hypothetical protein